jgi:hypothetical protein
VTPELQLLGLFDNHGVDPFVRFRETTQLVAETRGTLFFLNFDLTGESRDRSDRLRALVLLNTKQLHIEFVLILLLKESYEELGCAQRLRFQDCGQEPLVL